MSPGSHTHTRGLLHLLLTPFLSLSQKKKKKKKSPLKQHLFSFENLAASKQT